MNIAMTKKIIHSLETLLDHGLIKKNELISLQQVTDNFSFAITKQMLDRINPDDLHDPIAKQFIPSIEELHTSTLESIDPIGDDIHATVKGIVHRYPDRCLLMPIQMCPLYCRFCFRKEKVGQTGTTLSDKEIADAMAYIRSHPEIWEVILTGGDPFILKPILIKKLFEQLNTIAHVAVIRIHTRIPLVDSERINADMIAALHSNKAVYVVIHANHPNEFTVEGAHACAQLVAAGIPLLSQTTLLKNLNDNIEVMSELMRCFVKHRIKPYYVHHADLVRGTEHFRTSIAEGQALMKQLRGRFSGLCQPTYVLDIPGGYGKMPIGPNYLHAEGDEYTIEDYQGDTHRYL